MHLQMQGGCGALSVVCANAPNSSLEHPAFQSLTSVLEGALAEDSQGQRQHNTLNLSVLLLGFKHDSLVQMVKEDEEPA